MNEIVEWTIKIVIVGGVGGFASKLFYDHYQRVIGQRDAAKQRFLDSRFTGVEKAIADLKYQIEGIDKNIRAVGVKVNVITPDLQHITSNLAFEAARYEKLVNAFKVIIEKSDKKFDSLGGRITVVEENLSTMTKTIFTVDERLRKLAGHDMVKVNENLKKKVKP